MTKLKSLGIYKSESTPFIFVKEDGENFIYWNYKLTRNYLRNDDLFIREDETVVTEVFSEDEYEAST